MKNPYRLRKALLALPYFLIGSFPILLLLLRGVWDLLKTGPEAFLIFNPQRESILFLKTIAYASSVAAAVTVAGICAAVFVCSVGKNLYRRAAWVLFVSLPVPACVHAMAWLRWSKIINDLGLMRFESRGWVMSWIVQSMTFLPIAVLIIGGGVLSINKEQILAAQLLGDDKRFLTRLLLKYLKPQILATAAIVFMLTANDYAIPSIFSVSVYALEIFVEYSSSLSLVRMILKSLPLMILQTVLLVSLLNLISTVFISGRKGEFELVAFKFPRSIDLVSAFAAVLVMVQVAVPVSMMTLDQNMWLELGATWLSSSADLGTSLLISIIGAAIGCPVIYFAADWLSTTRFQKTGLFLVLLPAALPATIIGTALINLLNSPAMNAIYNSILMPVFAVMARFMPFGVIVTTAWFKRIDQDLVHAAAILERRAWRNHLLVLLPMISTGLFVGAAMIFLFGFGELGATVVVLPPGLSTMTVRLYNYLHYGATEMVLGLSFMIMAVIVVLAGLSKLLTWRKTK